MGEGFCDLVGDRLGRICSGVGLSRRIIMLALALGWALVGYIVYLVGVLWGLPDDDFLRLVFVCLVGISVWWVRRQRFIEVLVREVRDLWRSGLLERMLLILVSCQLILGLAGVFSPELSFDALWYHLTLPKMYLSWRQIDFPIGNLLPWGLPRLGEMWYTLALAADGSATLAKLMHFLAGLMSFLLIYSTAKRLSARSGMVLLTSAVWYTMLSVGWLSTAGYVDLFAVVFGLLAVRELVEGKRWTMGGVLLGLAASVKFVFVLPAMVVFGWVMVRRLSSSEGFQSAVRYLLGLIIAVIAWLGISWWRAGDPLYPLLRYQPESVVGAPLHYLWGRLTSILLAPWQWTIHPDTPISPAFLGLLPLFLVRWPTLGEKLKDYLVLGGIFVSSVWFFPEFSNRYLLPGLAMLTVPLAAQILLVGKQLRRVLVVFMVMAVLLNVGARAIATRKFIPYLMGTETRDEFLAKNLDLGVGNFFDEGEEIARFVGSQTVLVTGVHNLFYVDFPFEHVSWAGVGKQYRYVLVGEGGRLPPRYLKAKLLYKDRATGATLFSNETI